MALSSIVKQLHDGSLGITDGTGTPLTCVVRFSQGDFSAAGFKHKLNAVNHYQSRGVIVSSRYTERETITGSFSALVTDFSEATAGTIQDLILGVGAYSARVSTLAGDVMAFDITYTIDGTALGDADDPTFTLTDCVISWDYGESDPDVVSFSFECIGAVTGDWAIALLS